MLEFIKKQMLLDHNLLMIIYYFSLEGLFCQQVAFDSYTIYIYYPELCNNIIEHI